MNKSVKYQLRGFSKNKKSKIPIDILSLKHKLSDSQIEIGNNSYLEKLFDKNQKELEFIFRQYIFSKIYLSANLNKKIYESIGDGTKQIKYPIHKSWLKILQPFGFTVDGKYWNMFVTSQFIKGMYRFVQSLSFLVFRNDAISEYVYFSDLGPDNLKSYINQSSENIFSWYSKRFENNLLKYHGVKNRKHLSSGFESPEALYLKSIKISLPGLSKWIFYLLGSFRAITDSIIGLMHGNTARIILLPETLDYIYVNLIPKEKLAKEYLFNFSNHLYRPFWTYLAEEKGSKVTFYFYSTNIEVEEKNGLLPHKYAFQLATWSNYLVWDEYQKKYIESCIGKGEKLSPSIQVVGVIDFVSSQVCTQQLDGYGDYIVAFDVSCLRKNEFQAYSLPREYYIPKVMNKFILDINKACIRNNYKLIYKPKKNLGNRQHKGYKYNIELLENQENILVLNEGFSAHDLIKKAKMAISIPFTSTAIIAASEGIPTLYYDPLGIYKNGDPLAHGIRVINNFEELCSALQSINFQ